MSNNRLFAAGLAGALLGCTASGEDEALKPDESAQTTGAEAESAEETEVIEVYETEPAPMEYAPDEETREGGLTPPHDPSLPFD